MKKKIGPLPTWAWLVLAGGTIGIVLYLRKKASTGEGESRLTEAPLAATTGAAGAGAGSGGAPAEAASAAAGYAAQLAQLQESDATAVRLASIQAQGVINPSAPQTFAQEIEDVSGAVGALSALGSLFQAPKAAAAATQTATPGSPTRYLNKATGKMETAAQIKAHKAPAAKAKPKPKAVRRTVQHVAAKPKAVSHATPKPVHVTAPAQAHRAAPIPPPAHRAAPPPRKPPPRPPKRRR